MKPLFFDRDRPHPGDAYDLIRVDSADNRIPGYHYHAYPEIFWLVEGECEHFINGNRQVIHKGDGMFLRMFCDTHQFVPIDGKRFMFMNFVFTAEHFGALAQTHPEIFGLCFPEPPVPSLAFHLPDVILDEVDMKANQLLNQPNTRFFTEAFLFDFIQKVLSRNPTEFGRNDIPDWLARAYMAIQEQEYFSQGVKGFVTIAGRCPEHVSRWTRKYFGKSPIELVNDARMRFARKQLLITSRSIEEIAYECGFSDMSQFYHLFRTYFATSPGSFRRRRLQQTVS